MGILDDMTSDFSGSVDDINERMSELHEREAAGMLDDADRAELQKYHQMMGIDE